jgi:phospholipase A1
VAQAAPSLEGGKWAQRAQKEKETLANSQWAILPHRPNYVLPYTYSFHPNEAPVVEETGKNPDFKNYEIKFQLSFKLPVWPNMFGSNWTLAAAYTQVCMWQAYDDNDSAPFRDTNYEPEAVVATPLNWDVLGFTMRNVAFGAVHQSNGRGKLGKEDTESLSRSWNRLYAVAVFERGNFVWSLKPWWRVPEDREDDNNHDIEKYYGYGELRAGYEMGNNTFSMMLRNNLRSENKGAVELGWSFPLTGRIKGYVQYFNGYGESLYDFDHPNERIGAGVLLSDWL